jgi:hypothetical protein
VWAGVNEIEIETDMESMCVCVCVGGWVGVWCESERESEDGREERRCGGACVAGSDLGRDWGPRPGWARRYEPGDLEDGDSCRKGVNGKTVAGQGDGEGLSPKS